jgi:hypothetical protein
MKDKTPLVNPMTMKMIDNTKLILMIYGWWLRLTFGKIW